MGVQRTLGINGLGRIGKLVLWYHLGRDDFERIVVNVGRPVGTSQNRQERVHTSPRIMMVNDRRLQHSPMLGQDALSHTVCSPCACTWARRPK